MQGALLVAARVPQPHLTHRLVGKAQGMRGMCCPQQPACAVGRLERTALNLKRCFNSREMARPLPAAFKNTSRPLPRGLTRKSGAPPFRTWPSLMCRLQQAPVKRCTVGGVIEPPPPPWGSSPRSGRERTPGQGCGGARGCEGLGGNWENEESAATGQSQVGSRLCL